MKNLLRILPFILGLMACGETKSPEQKPGKKEWSFQSMAEEAPALKLPLVFHHETDDPEGIPLEVPEEFREKVWNATQLLGKLEVNENIMALVFTIPADDVVPVVVTFDKQGDTISFLLTNIGYPDGPWGDYHPWARINPDLSIELGDSGMEYDLDSNMNRIGKHPFNRMQTFRIREDGEIVPVKPI